MRELIRHNVWVNRPEYEAAALRVLRSGHVAAGPEVAAFERELAQRFRPGGEAVCVSSGTAALAMAVKVADFLDDSLMSLPVYTCGAIPNAAEAWGYGAPYCDKTQRIDWVDCDQDTLNSPSSTVAIHTYGAPCDVGPAAIENFTHAPGGSLNGKACGSMGELSIISFGATKPLGVGAGGAVLGSPEAIKEIRDRMDYERPGDRFNWSMSDIQAAIGRVRLKRLDEENEWRARTAKVYERARRTARGDCGYSLGDFQFGGYRSGAQWRRVWYRYVIRLRQVEEARARFAAAGIETIVPIRTDELIHRQLGMDPALFPNAEEVARTTLSLPIWPGMTDEQVERVAECLSTMGDLE